MKQWIFVILMVGFYFFYVGSEVLFSVYIVAFCVKSDLGLTKIIGSQISATFWACSASMRFLGIFSSRLLKPIYLMFGNIIVSLFGAILLTILGNQSVTVLWIGSGLFGAGMASMYATAMLWFESHVKITNPIGKYLLFITCYYIVIDCFESIASLLWGCFTFGTITFGPLSLWPRKIWAKDFCAKFSSLLFWTNC